MKKRRIHLLCNAHLDPVWLWEWQEGAAEAVSTFRTAADLCAQDRAFIFNHNEVILYQWVQRYEPQLFARIQRLVKQGRWHIMGGWYLQPDCNMPSGESLVRQILRGRQFFLEHFGVAPTTAVNVDPFGHSRGLVQILAKSGYDSYLFGRPSQKDCPLPADEFVWVGYDRSRITASRFNLWYNSPLGGARRKIEQYLAEFPDRNPGLVLWGVGNHGGGPSRQDLRDVDRLIGARHDVELMHSTPEAYFRDLAAARPDLPQHDGDLNPWGTGCYTSQIRIKQRYRQLENEIYALEKMAVTAAWNRLIDYPAGAIRTAFEDLMTSQFHDILPGSSIEPVEAAALRTLDHGLEITARAKAAAFFALSSGQPRAQDGQIPILVYNPCPYPVRQVIEVEFQLPDYHPPGTCFTQVEAFQNGRRVPCQVEKEASNLPVDWRKRVALLAWLAPSTISRFDCRLVEVARKPPRELKVRRGSIAFESRALKVLINATTGLVDQYQVQGADLVGPAAFRPLVMVDNADPWGMLHGRYDAVEGAFALMTPAEAASFSGLDAATCQAVRVIEDGPVRAVVEALFRYRESFICQQYRLPKTGTEIEVETRVFWNQKDRMLKLEIPIPRRGNRYVGQVAYGVGDLPHDGTEAVAQQWVAVVNRQDNLALSCINDGTYGSDFADATGLRLTLLRSPAYACMPWDGKIELAEDRFLPRIDQGQRRFRFWLNGGPVSQRINEVDREALAHNQRPMALAFFPPGRGRRPKPVAVIEGKVIQITALKKTEQGNDLLVRLFNPSGRKRSARLHSPLLAKRWPVTLEPFEIKTYRISRRPARAVETNLLEEPL